MIARFVPFSLCAVLLAGLAGCGEPKTGPVEISAIGPSPKMVNPNLQPLEPPTSLLVEAVAQGLVRFDSAGEIEPALAQSWIVSDDGLRYTFRLSRTNWSGAGRVTAPQVVARLRAVLSRASRNPLKPVLGAVDDIVAMTDEVLEISLRAPRPNFLQLLAQPEMGVLLNGRGSGPYLIARSGPDGILLISPPSDPEEEEQGSVQPDLLLRGEPAAMAIARFAEGETDAVFGGTLGDLPIARAANAGARLQFDPVSGLFGLAFASADGPLADAAVRQALSMTIDRASIVADLAVPGQSERTSLLPQGVQELPAPSRPGWADSPLPMRRELASRTIASLQLVTPLRLRVAIPDSPGYRLLFARLRHDWSLIGVEARRVEPGAAADLRLVDDVAPAMLASWYLRHFTCAESAICDPAADLAMEAARTAATPAERRTQLVAAAGILTGLTPFIPLASPVRWSLVSQRLTGFRTNPLGRHPPAELIAETR